MTLLQHFILLSSLVLLSKVRGVPISRVYLSHCTDTQYVNAYWGCGGKLDRLKEITNQTRSELDAAAYYEEMSQICESALDCFSTVRCEEGIRLIKPFEELCQYSVESHVENRNCFVGFLRKAYLGRFTSYQDIPCFQGGTFSPLNFDRMEENYRRDSHCFMRHVFTSCGYDAQNHFSRYYQKLLETLTEAPTNEADLDAALRLRSFYCVALMEETRSRVTKFEKFKTFLGISKMTVDDMKILCKDTKECITDYKYQRFFGYDDHFSINQICKDY